MCTAFALFCEDTCEIHVLHITIPLRQISQLTIH